LTTGGASPSGCNWSVECDPAHGSVINGLVENQLNVLERVLTNAKALTSTTANAAYFPTTIGTMASGYLTREFRSSQDPDAVRPTFVKPVWNASGPGPVSGNFDGNIVTFSPLLSGVHYSTFGAMATNKSGSLCAPCSVLTSTEAGELSTDTAPECGGCIDLCDASRLIATGGWAMVAGKRGMVDDCWWETTAPGSLYLPEALAPFLATKCTFSFSYHQGNWFGAGSFRVYRDSPVGEELVWDSMSKLPFVQNTPDRLTTLVFDANELLPAGRVPQFRFEFNAVVGRPRVFDPVVYCKVFP